MHVLLLFLAGLTAGFALVGAGVFVYALLLWVTCGKVFLRRVIRYYKDRL